MNVLLRTVHGSHWRRQLVQSSLPLLGIAIGVASIVAIGLGGNSTVASFEWTMQRLEGRATHQVLPGSAPLPLPLAYELADIPGIDAAAPVLETLLLAGEPLRVYGIDSFAEAEMRDLGLQRVESLDFREFLSRPGALVVSPGFLERRGLAPGDSLAFSNGSRRGDAIVLAALPARIDELEVPDNLAVCDLATAQELSGAAGLSRIDLILAGDGREETLAKIRERLPAGAEVAEPGGRASHMRSMLDALRSNLRALSYLSLFVALFLIYNAMSLAVLRRRGEIGILRSLGATPRQLRIAWLSEALALGVVGSALGVVLGMLAGRWVQQDFARSAEDLYGHLGATRLHVDLWLFGQATFIGIATSLMAAWIPARQASSVPVARVGMRSEAERHSRAGLRRLWASATCVGALASAALLLPTRASWPGYFAAIGLALAVAMIAPYLAERGLAALRPREWLGLLPAMAIDNIRRSLSRTGLAIAALCVALAMSIAMGTMVESFRREVRDWIGDSIRADVYISTPLSEIDFDSARIGPELLAALRSWPAVVAVDSYRGAEAELGALRTRLAAVDVAVLRSRAEPRLLDGSEPREYFDRLEAGQAGISEALMRKSGLRVGDRMRVRVRGQELELQIAGVVRDYSSDRGNILVDVAQWQSIFGAEDPNSVALYLREGSDVEATVQELRRHFGTEYALLIRSQRALRDQALIVFDRTFSVARSLELLGIAVAAIGILSALLALLLERGRELATLRALGMTSRQLAAMLAMESSWMALLSWLMALPLGAGLAWILLRVIQTRSFGWSLPMRAPVAGWFENLLLALVAAALATLPALLRARRLSIAVALRRE